MTIYKDLRPFGFPFYRIGEDGSLWSLRHKNGKLASVWRELSIKPSGKGYRVATLTNEHGVRCMVAVRSLMLEVFVGPRPSERHQACHGNGVPWDDRLDNLRWDTPEGNQQDRLKHGTDNRGEKSGRAVLTEEKVAQIRERLATGETCVSIARIEGVSYGAVQHIKHRRNWGWM